jgi:WD40 repeat protein/energy-coupling factor transporter ATP-binding protein EcfA2
MSKIMNPFPGLRPFHEDESHLFFGRENHTKEILRKLNTYRFVSVVGNSGSGKSSLIKAGVLPQLVNQEDKLWEICHMRPGKDPVFELSKALFSEKLYGAKDTAERVKQIEEKEQILRKNQLGLVQAVRHAVPEGKRLLILVDQFEELFRFSDRSILHNEKDSASHFIDLLLNAAAQKDVSIYIIMTIRSDFLGDCEQFIGLPEAINDGQFLIPRMNREEIQLSITGPIEYVEGKISPRLVQKLLNELGNNPDQLPILQHVLMQTWKEWDLNHSQGQPLDLEHYEKTGGMVKALSIHAEEAYSELKNDRQKHLAEVMFKAITLKGGDNRGIRRPTQLGDIAKIAEAKNEEIIEIVEIFRAGDRGFIMPPVNVPLTEKSVIDISHESLMRVWERLTKWVDEEAESADLYQRISDSAILYQKEMAGLWRDPDLQIALAWRETNQPTLAWANQYNPNFAISMRFIEASLVDKKFIEREKIRKSKYIRAALIAFLVVLSGLSIWAFSERNSSLKNAEAAIIQSKSAEKQKGIAEQQKNLAIQSLAKAEIEEQNAHAQEAEAIRLGKIALQSAEVARLEKIKAESAKESALSAKIAAEKAEEIALKQKNIADGLRVTAESAQKNATRLRLLSLAQNIAIKSQLADNSTYKESVKSLLALQAYKFNKENSGKTMDPEIYGALFSSLRASRSKETYVQVLHSDVVKSICFNPLNNSLASTGNDGILCISNLNATEGSKQCSNAMPLIFDHVAYNKSGDHVASTCDKNNVFVYNSKSVESPEKIIKNIHTAEVSGLIWYKDNLISSCYDMKIRLIDVKNEKAIKTIRLVSKPVSMALNSDKGVLYIGCDNGSIYSVNINTDTSAKVFKSGLQGRIMALTLNKTNTFLAYGTSDATAAVLQTATGKTEMTLHGHKASVMDIEFNSTSNLLATACLDGKVRLWNADMPDEAPIVFSEHESWVMNVAFNASGEYLASAGKDKTIRIYPISLSGMAKELESSLNRNFTKEEWLNFIGADIPYENTLSL